MYLILFCLSSFACLLCLFVCVLFHLVRSFGQVVLVTLWTGFPLTYLYYDRAIFYKIQRIFPYKKIRDSYQSLLNVKFAYDICYTQARAEDLWQWRDSSFNSTFSRTTRNEVLSSAPPPYVRHWFYHLLMLYFCVKDYFHQNEIVGAKPRNVDDTFMMIDWLLMLIDQIKRADFGLTFTWYTSDMYNELSLRLCIHMWCVLKVHWYCVSGK